MDSTAPDRTGLAAGLACYLAWGLLPLLFQAAERAGASAFEVVAWRTIVAVPFALTLVLIVRQGPAVRGLTLQDVGMLALSAALIGGNWLVYVWAVTHHRTLEGSLGYYINPLLNMAAGRWLFGERIDRTGWAAIALAAAGVALQALALGAFPWVSLGLAVSFCAYAVVRKRMRTPAQAGLFVECLLLLGPALAFVAWTVLARGAPPTHGARTAGLLFLCGPATVIPLACFAMAARRLPLTVMGFLQFIAPTLQFAIGVANGEALTPLRLLSFAFIWTGVAVFAASAVLRGRAARAAVRTEAAPA